MKLKLIHAIYGILFVFFLSIGKLAVSKEDSNSPGTRWLEVDNYIGASKANYSNLDNIKEIIEPIQFPEDISIPGLPVLQDIPLTEEDK